LAVLRAVPGVINVEALSATRFKILHTIEAGTAEALLTLSAQQGWQAQQLTPIQGKPGGRIRANHPAAGHPA